MDREEFSEPEDRRIPFSEGDASDTDDADGVETQTAFGSKENPDGSGEEPESDSDRGSRKRRKRRRSASRKRRGRVYSRKYKIIWGIYWTVTAFLLAVLVPHVFRMETMTGISSVIPGILLIAAVPLSALLCTRVLYPRAEVDDQGREVLRQIRPWHFLWMLAADGYAFLILEYVNNPILGEMEWKYILLNIAGILIMNLILFFWLNSLKKSLMVILIAWSGLAATFYYVYAFRGEPLQLIDFYSIGTALTVAGNYSFVLPGSIVIDLILGLCLLALVIHMPKYVLVRKGLFRKILMRVAVTVFMIAMVPFYLTQNWNGKLGILTDLFAPIKTYKEYGTTVGFFCVAKYMRLTAPDGYSVSEAKEIAEESVEEQVENTVTDVKPVNIICIMNESWADYRYVGDLETNEEVMPFYDSLTENTIKGHTLVCIRGGGTAKTEYEFLTGNSVKRFPGMVPYVSYFTHDQYSLVTTLEAQGYESAAMHPYKGSNWKRTTAYQLLNFDTFYTQEDFDEDVLKYHNHISDQANYEKIIELIENKEDSSQPFFLFDITMQNHGGYTADDVEQTIQVEGYDNDVVNRYLSLLKLSDDALEYLIEYFEDYEEPTIIVMFGDHYPTMPDEFTEYISGKSYDELTLSEEMNYYATPFLIWANYDIPEQENVITSTNYLGTLMLEQTGLEMADYNYYLKNLMEEIPALNHLGYMDAEGEYHSWDDGEEEELQLEWEYECLQYNNLAEKRNRLDWFFGLTTDAETVEESG